MEEYRKKVVDISDKNQLVNFKPYSYSLEIEYTQPAIKNLMMNENGIPLTNKENEDEDESSSENRYLKVNFSEETKGNPFEKLYKKSSEYFRETGINTVFLAVGFLSWKNGPNKKRNSPLVLIPVHLNKDRTLPLGYSIKYTSEPIERNYPAYKTIKEAFGLDIPDIGEYDIGGDTSLTDYFDDVCEKIRQHPEESKLELDRDDCYLSCFEMKKTSIREDLDYKKWEHTLSNENIGRIFHRNGGNKDDHSQADTPNIHHVLDVDKSQKKVLDEASGGKSFVVQGPPGTGKSQTIVNIICSAVKNKKTVLFVAEKLTALRVVKDKIDDLGLEDTVLELHGDKNNKGVFFEGLKKTLDGSSEQMPSKNVGSSKDIMDKMKILEEYLNGYDESMVTEIVDTGLNPADTIEEIIKLRERLEHIEEPPEVKDIGFWSKEKYDNVEKVFKKYSLSLEENGHPTNSIFVNCSRGDYFKLMEFSSFKEDLRQLSGELKTFSSSYSIYTKKGMPEIDGIMGIDHAERILRTVDFL